LIGRKGWKRGDAGSQEELKSRSGHEGMQGGREGGLVCTWMRQGMEGEGGREGLGAEGGRCGWS
jgi:hypothetical protein